MRVLLGWLVAVVLLPGLVMGQPLADRVPSDAVVYVGWAGTGSLAGRYQGTHLEGVMQHSDIPQLADRVLPGLLDRVREDNADAAELMEQLCAMVRISAKYPIAVYLRDFAGEGERLGEQLEATVLVDAGAGAADLAQRLAALQKEGSRNQVRREGELVILSPRIDAYDAASPLSGNERFIRAAGQMQDQPALAVYIDVQGIRGLMSRAAGGQMTGDGPADMEPAGSPEVRVGLHLLEGMDGVAFSAGFEGKQWRTRTFVDAPAPRSGLAALLDAEPISDDLLRAIPREAEWVAVRRLDLGKLHDVVRAAFAVGVENGGTLFDQLMGAATLGLGANPKTMVFDPLGDQWAVYVAPAVAGDSVLGGVLLNRVDDPARIQRGLSSIAIAMTNLATGQTPAGVQFRVGYTQHQGTRISYLTTPFVAPAWAVKGNLLVMGLYPQTVAAALDATEAGDSILDNPAFQQVRRDLGDRAMTSIGFVDLEKTAPKTYPTLLMWAQLYGGMGDMLLADVPPMLIPSIKHLRPHLVPAGRAAWVDERGWHAMTVTPFPMAELLGGEISQIVQQAPVLGLFPALFMRHPTGPQIPTQAYFTVDDGQTWFADDIEKIPPFEHQGQQAVRVQLFTCDGGKTVFPVYLERYSDEAQAAMERIREGDARGEVDVSLYEQFERGQEVKRARDPDAPWVRTMNFDRSGEIMTPRCPDGSFENLEPVFP